MVGVGGQVTYLTVVASCLGCHGSYESLSHDRLVGELTHTSTSRDLQPA